MNGWQIGLIAWFACSALLTVAMVGKPRKTTTPGVAVIVLILIAVEIYAVVKA